MLGPRSNSLHTIDYTVHSVGTWIPVVCHIARHGLYTLTLGKEDNKFTFTVYQLDTGEVGDARWKTFPHTLEHRVILKHVK